jgi:hypothetical protein
VLGNGKANILFDFFHDNFLYCSIGEVSPVSVVASCHLLIVSMHSPLPDVRRDHDVPESHPQNC